jgi:hypothetical protein
MSSIRAVTVAMMRCGRWRPGRGGGDWAVVRMELVARRYFGKLLNVVVLVY